jgi:uridine kinase
MQNLKSIFGRKYATSRAKILGIVGCTNTGKSTLAEEFTKLVFLLLKFLSKIFNIKLNENGIKTGLIKQDDFYKCKEEVKTIANAENPSIIFYDYDQIEAVYLN